MIELNQSQPEKAKKYFEKAADLNPPDLSAGYDDLIVFDILQDWSFPQPFDLVYSADAFVYFGNLDSTT